MPSVRIDDPPTMNVLGLFLAAALRRSTVERGRECPLRGNLEVAAGAMTATVRFEEDGIVVTRAQGPSLARVSAPLHRLVRAIVHPNPVSLLRVRARGNRIFLLRALRWFAP